MSTSNLGNQTVYFEYDSDYTSEEVNKRLYKVIKPGIYEGADLSMVLNVLTISAFVGLFRTSTGQVVEIITSSNVTSDLDAGTPNIPVTAALPYVIGSYVWANNTGNYIDFSAKALGSIATNDIVFGKCNFSGSTVTSFDLSNRTYGIIDQDSNVYANGIALTANNSVDSGLINSGVVITGTTDSSGIIGYLDGVQIHIQYI